MKSGAKTLKALLLAFAMALLMGATSSYAFTVKDGETVLDSPDENRWYQRVGTAPDGRQIISNVFEGSKAEVGLSVHLSASDLRLSDDTDPDSGEIIYYVFVNNTSVYAELTKEDDAIILKDNTCILTNTGTEVSSEDISGGIYTPPANYSEYFFYESTESDELADIIAYYLNKYPDVYEEMLVTYEAVKTDPDDDISGDDIIIIGGPPVIGDPEGELNNNPGKPDEESDDELKPAPEPTPQPEPVPAPAPEPVPAPEPIPEKEIVKNEPEIKTLPAPKVFEQKKEELIPTVKDEDIYLPKRIETTIIGEVLNHRIAATVPAGVDERSVSKLQKQISDTIDGLIQEITDDRDSAKGRVSEETLNKIEKAISEGKDISAELVVEKVEAESIPASDAEAFVRVAADNEHSNLKIGKYFNISILIKTEDGEELGTYNEMTDMVTLTLPRPKDIPCPKGMEYVVIRIHDKETTIIPVKVNRDGSLSFETDRFSSYALAVREVVDEEVAKAPGMDSAKASAKGGDLMDFVKWFLRILLFAFASGTIVILSSFIDKKRAKKK